MSALRGLFALAQLGLLFYIHRDWWDKEAEPTEHEQFCAFMALCLCSVVLYHGIVGKIFLTVFAFKAGTLFADAHPLRKGPPKL